MRTSDVVPGRDASAEHEARGVRPALRTPLRLIVVLAAFLAFGLLGLLVAVRVPTRRVGRPLCRCCRRRGGLTLACTFALAGLVVAGSGMAVHQHIGGPGLPDCGRDLSGSATVYPEDPVEDVAGSVWLRTRQVLTAPVSGLVRHYVDDRGGGLCKGSSMTLAFLPSAASHSSVAVGDVVLTGDRSGMRDAGEWNALAGHESRHVSQWAALTLAGGPLAMPLLYAVDEAFYPDSRNHFERAADLDDGGYPHPENFGPRPQWTKVATIGLLLVAVGWRRLRWASRVLTGGAAAAAAHQRGDCPVHSRGWFRSQEPRALDPEPRWP